jgi:hypothetical protein
MRRLKNMRRYPHGLAFARHHAFRTNSEQNKVESLDAGADATS